jgi:hypothetical protein
MTPPHHFEGIYTYDSIMKPTKHWKEEDGMDTRNVMERVNLFKVHYADLWNYHS